VAQRSGEQANRADVDAALVQRAGRGDQAALAELLTRHQDRTYAMCFRMLGDRERARDVAQDAMVRVIESLSSFDGRAAFGTWMTRVTINLCLSHLRREKLRRHASLDAPQGGPEREGSGRSPLWAALASEAEPQAGSSVEEGERRARLAAALVGIEPEQRAILILRDVRGLDYRQIGEALDVAVGTVKSRLFRARTALREAMERLATEGMASGTGDEQQERR